jgi:transposase-like protein
MTTKRAFLPATIPTVPRVPIDLTPPEGLPAIPDRGVVPGAQEGKGRPTKLVQPVVRELLAALEDGLFYEQACSIAGVNYTTVRAWIRQAEADIKAGDATVYVTFLYFMEVTLARVERSAAKEWQAQFKDDWRAARDFLERRFPDRWAPKNELNVKGHITHGIVMLPPLSAKAAGSIDGEYEVLEDGSE